MPIKNADIVIIGAGIAGASLAFELAGLANVVILESEAQPGYHSTGRSIALFSELYGSYEIRALSRRSRAFLDTPPVGFSEVPLLTPRGVLFFNGPGQEEMSGTLFGQVSAEAKVERLSSDEALRLSPHLDPAKVSGAIFEPGAMDIDVHGLLTGYLNQAKAKGVTICANSTVLAMSRRAGIWQLQTRDDRFEAPIVVNAVGAWADEIASLAGAAPIRLLPLRRTVVTIDDPTAIPGEWPVTGDIDETFYFRPDAGRIIFSPSDETIDTPNDVQPGEFDVALAASRLEEFTKLTVKRIVSKWAGLRNFAPDRLPVLGFDPQVEGFFWLAGQGGYGIQTAPAMARFAATLLSGRELSEEDRALCDALARTRRSLPGVEASALSV